MDASHTPRDRPAVGRGRRRRPAQQAAMGPANRHRRDLRPDSRREVRRPGGAGPASPAGRPSSRRRWPVWLLVAVAVAAITGGALTGHGLLLAAGLVLAAVAAHLFDPGR